MKGNLVWIALAVLVIAGIGWMWYGASKPLTGEVVAKLAGVYKKKGEDRLIVVPRPALDARFALTAWTRIDKLKDFDEGRIIKFIDAFRNQGPEKTME